MSRTGSWVTGYIGNKFVERSPSASTYEETEFKTPLRDFSQPEEFKELISTERFLYDKDIERNPYLFETDEFVR